MRSKILCKLKNIGLRLKYDSRLKLQGIIYTTKKLFIYIDSNSQIFIGDKTRFQIGNHLSAVAGGKIHIGSGCSFNRYCILVGREEIHIGNQCIFGPNVLIYDHDHQYSTDGITNKYNTGSVIIENGCWIGGNVTVLRNTHIGEGSVIGAGCVVHGDIPAHSIVTSGRELKVCPIE